VRRTAVTDHEARVSTEHFTVDLSAKQVHDVDDDVVRLRPTEWRVLEVLVRDAGKLFSQRQLLQDVWDRRTVTRATTRAWTWPTWAPSSNPTARTPAT